MLLISYKNIVVDNFDYVKRNHFKIYICFLYIIVGMMVQCFVPQLLNQWSVTVKINLKLGIELNEQDHQMINQKFKLKCFLQLKISSQRIQIGETSNKQKLQITQFIRAIMQLINTELALQLDATSADKEIEKDSNVEITKQTKNPMVD